MVEGFHGCSLRTDPPDSGLTLGQQSDYAEISDYGAVSKQQKYYQCSLIAVLCGAGRDVLIVV